MSFWKDNIEDDVNVFFLTLFSSKNFFIKNVSGKSLYSRKKLFWPIRESLCSRNAKFLRFFSLRTFLRAKVSAHKVFDLILGFWQSFLIFSLLIWTVAHTPIRHVIFWDTVIKTFRSIYVNCFNTLRFLAEVSTKLQKMYILDNLRTITKEGSMETRQMTPFFIYFFFYFCNILFHIWKWSKFIFLWSTLRSILVCKIPQFWAIATDSDSPSYFSRK